MAGRDGDPASINAHCREQKKQERMGTERRIKRDRPSEGEHDRILGHLTMSIVLKIRRSRKTQERSLTRLEYGEKVPRNQQKER
jgi:hypothetical protein